MPEGKWLHDLEATTPLPEAARRVLSARLEAVRHYLPLALLEPDKDPEHVHQLRVGTRRAGAALAIFAPCLPAKIFEKARKRLRRLRRAAGAARDWDVFLEGLAARKHRVTGHRPGNDFLLGHALGQRIAAQAQLQEASPLPLISFERLIARTIDAVQQAEAGTLTEMARPHLLGLVNELDEAFGTDLENYENLHRVRILGKRLRYAMEVFASCFPHSFKEEIYPMVEEMQEILGHANDSQVAQQHLLLLQTKVRAARPADWKRFQPEIEGLLRYHQRRLPQERRRFLVWQEKWRKSGGRARLIDMLTEDTTALR